jgi:hypothetical protein
MTEKVVIEGVLYEKVPMKRGFFFQNRAKEIKRNIRVLMENEDEHFNNPGVFQSIRMETDEKIQERFRRLKRQMEKARKRKTI